MRNSALAISVLAALCLWFCGRNADAEAMRYQYWSMSSLDKSRCAITPVAQGRALTTPFVKTASWDELVVSWNATASHPASLEVYVRAKESGRLTGWYDMGCWSEASGKSARTSRKGLRDADGSVHTDVLRLKHPGSGFQVRVVMRKSASVRYLGVSLANRKVAMRERPANRAAWGRDLDVPGYSQLAYPKGHDWCSPTSIAMVLAYWARTGAMPAWKRTVPQCAAGTYDKAWDGTGNWSFNAAYAGSIPGLRAYVTRLPDTRALEDWIAQGIPVVLAVSVDLSRAEETPGKSGHLIVCTGFTAAGDLIVNDPWAHLKRGECVRRIVPRARLGALWRNSEHTVYIVHPISLNPFQETTIS